MGQATTNQNPTAESTSPGVRDSDEFRAGTQLNSTAICFSCAPAGNVVCAEDDKCSRTLIRQRHQYRLHFPARGT